MAIISTEALVTQAEAQAKELERLKLVRTGMRFRFRDGSVCGVAMLAHQAELTIPPQTVKTVAFGIAVCSPKDEYSWLHARVVSTGRALNVFKKKHNLYPIKLRPAVAGNLAMLSLYAGVEFKGVYNPTLEKLFITPEDWIE